MDSQSFETGLFMGLCPPESKTENTTISDTFVLAKFPFKAYSYSIAKVQLGKKISACCMQGANKVRKLYKMYT